MTVAIIAGGLCGLTAFIAGEVKNTTIKNFFYFFACVQAGIMLGSLALESF